MADPVRIETPGPGSGAGADAGTRTGALQGACFGGLLEGRVGDRLALERAVRRLREEGPVDVALEVEGPRFALYLDDAPVGPERAEPVRLQVFLDVLGEVVAAAEGGPLDSTLRCTEVYEDEVVETHIGVEDGELRPVSRARVRMAEDALRLPSVEASQELLDDRSRRVLVAVAATLLLALTLWQARVVDRVFGASAEALSAAPGPFAELLDVRVEQALGGYRVVLARGADYPLTGADVQGLESASGSPLERAAVAAVADGGSVQLRVLDAEGAELASARARLDALLVGADASVEVLLPARIGAATVELGVPVGRAAARGGLR